MLEHLDDLRRAYDGRDGLALLRALLREGPLAGRTALVSSFGAESAVLLHLIAQVDPDSGNAIADFDAKRLRFVQHAGSIQAWACIRARDDCRRKEVFSSRRSESRSADRHH